MTSSFSTVKNGTTWVGTLSTGINITPHAGEAPKPVPEALIATRAVQTKSGWLGQVIIDARIIWETTPQRGEDAAQDAIDAANEYVVDRIRAIFEPEVGQ